ncbi:MAG: cytochrome P450 [Actinomycetota bacterium]
MRVERFVFPIIRQVVARPRLADALFRWDRWGNQLGPDRYSWPYPGFERIRADGPVAWHRLYNSWFVTGYNEARELLSHPNAIVEPQRELLFEVPPYTKLSPRATEVVTQFLLLVDPPMHTRLRALVSRAFTPRQVERIRPAATAIVSDLLDAVADDPEPDLFTALCQPLPVQVISELIGVPRDRWAWLQECSSSMVKILNPFVAFDPLEVSETVADFDAYFRELAAERRAQPTEDLLSALVEAEADGDRLSEDELVSMVAFLLFAGYETTMGLIGTSLVALARHPEQRARLMAEPDLWSSAIEELVRWDPTVQSDPRSVSVDTEVGGVTIKAGQSINVFLGAVNRDPQVFSDPNELRLDRNEAPPLSFGHGIHYCIGASLARMELQAALDAVLDRFGAYTIDESRIEWVPSLVTRGPRVLPVRAVT